MYTPSGIPSAWRKPSKMNAAFCDTPFGKMDILQA